MIFGRALSESTDLRRIVAGLSGGKTSASKVMLSPLSASNSAWRKVPGPLSAVLLTTRGLPRGIVASVASGMGTGGAVTIGVEVYAVGAGAKPGKKRKSKRAMMSRRLLVL